MTPSIGPNLDDYKPITGNIFRGYAHGVPKQGQKSTLPTGLRKVVADKLQAIKDLHGYTDAELGEEIGISRQTVTRYLKCEHAIDVDTLQAIGDVFNIAYPKLLDGEIPDGKTAQNDTPKTPPGVTPHSVRGDIPTFTKGSTKRNVHRKS